MLRGGSAGQGAAGSPRPERSPTRSWFKSAMAPFKGSSVFSLRLRCGGAAWSVTYSYKELLAFDAQLRASAAPAARALPELPVARGPSVLRLGALQSWLAAVLDALAEPAAAAADDDDDDAELDFSKKKKKKPALDALALGRLVDGGGAPHLLSRCAPFFQLHVPHIVKLQARARGWLARRRWREAVGARIAPQAAAPPPPSPPPSPPPP